MDGDFTPSPLAFSSSKCDVCAPGFKAPFLPSPPLYPAPQRSREEMQLQMDALQVKLGEAAGALRAKEELKEER